MQSANVSIVIIFISLACAIVWERVTLHNLFHNEIHIRKSSKPLWSIHSGPGNNKLGKKKEREPNRLLPIQKQKYWMCTPKTKAKLLQLVGAPGQLIAVHLEAQCLWFWCESYILGKLWVRYYKLFVIESCAITNSEFWQQPMGFPLVISYS